ncbi:bifunctional oligoribonuclease/PAP phosphatase NrnA [Corynebacterium sp. LK2510]|uniref:bifunctional oligoribonuclease/PAP phosphatase NrnA n=1 Tax=Corynebacterium sp. LK2510 TaxID=3110472 RepID=UPI0034D0037B
MSARENSGAAALPLLFPDAVAEFTEVARRLRAARTVNVVTHVRPDADAIGSACGLVLGLRKAGIAANAFVGQTETHPDNLDTIPGVEDVTYGGELPATDLTVTVDCASLDRTGEFQDELQRRHDSVVVIDHHATNPGFGVFNLILGSESTTTMVREVLRYMDVDLDTDIARCLYAGLVTDTGNFRWGTSRMHHLAAELLEYDLDTRGIAMNLMDSMSVTDLQVLGEVYGGLQCFDVAGLNVSVLTITVDNLAAMGQTTVEAVIDRARTLQGSDIGVVLKQVESEFWNVSLRSSSVDVSRIAERLGGGGHVPAAGFSAVGTRADVVDRLLRAI